MSVGRPEGVLQPFDAQFSGMIAIDGDNIEAANMRLVSIVPRQEYRGGIS